MVKREAHVLDMTQGNVLKLILLFSVPILIGNVFQQVYNLVDTFIGVLGAYMSGSNTVSNLLFSGLQFETATLLGLPQAIICAMQSNGGAIGNMVCVNNVVQVCGTTGCLGKEGRLISRTVIPAVIYCLIIVVIQCIVVFVMGYDPYPLPIQG